MSEREGGMEGGIKGALIRAREDERCGESG